MDAKTLLCDLQSFVQPPAEPEMIDEIVVVRDDGRVDPERLPVVGERREPRPVATTARRRVL